MLPVSKLKVTTVALFMLKGAENIVLKLDLHFEAARWTLS